MGYSLTGKTKTKETALTWDIILSCQVRQFWLFSVYLQPLILLSAEFFLEDSLATVSDYPTETV